MFVSYKWLEDYVDLEGIQPDELAEKSQEAELKWKPLNIKAKALKELLLDTSWSENSTRMPTN
ncbi:hypothetical protein ACEQPO_21345 [Bacillus sp. SL00103]